MHGMHVLCHMVYMHALSVCQFEEPNLGVLFWAKKNTNVETWMLPLSGRLQAFEHVSGYDGRWDWQFESCLSLRSARKSVGQSRAP